MGPMSRKRIKTRTSVESVRWLPIDSRIFSPIFAPIFSFGRVRGVAKFFLIVEMVLTILVVAGTFVLVGLSLAS